MTYLQAIEKLYANPTSKNSSGNSVPCVIRREEWPEGKVMCMAKQQPRLAFAALDPKTQKHGNPELTRELTNIIDLGSKDWDYFNSASFFG